MLARLVADKKLVRMKVSKGYAYTATKENGAGLAVDVEGEEAKAIREDLKRLNAAEVWARMDSR